LGHFYFALTEDERATFAEIDTDTKFDALDQPDLGVALDHCFWTSTAQFTASATLGNSMMPPSPVRLTPQPWSAAMVGSIRSLRIRSIGYPRQRDATKERQLVLHRGACCPARFDVDMVIRQ